MASNHGGRGSATKSGYDNTLPLTFSLMTAVAVHSGTAYTVNVVVETFYGSDISAVKLRTNNETNVGAYWLVVGKQS